MGGPWNHWSEIEDSAVREYYPTRGAKGCEKILRELGHVRTADAIKVRAMALGVRRDMSTVTRDVDGAWTEPELFILRSVFPTGGAQGVMEKLRESGYERTVGSISTRASILGVKTANSRRRAGLRSGKTKLINICLDTGLDGDVIGHLEKQRNRSEYIRELVRSDMRDGQKK